MMQVVDRRSQAGPSSATATTMVHGAISSPQKSPSFPQSPRTSFFSDSKASSTPLKSSINANHPWSSSVEDSVLARTQQFIVETHKNPILFTLSDAPVSAEVPYPPINDSNIAIEKERKASVKGKEAAGRDENGSSSASVYTSTKVKADSADSSEQGSSIARDLFTPRISHHPPKDASEKGVGLQNKGNTCYMNSTLQALMHLPPLSHALLSHDSKVLYGRLGGAPSQKFDALGEMVNLIQRVLTKRSQGYPQSPNAFIQNLKSYAKPLSKFRQEDAHEFLRFLLEAMQTCCLIRAPKSMKPNDPLRETTLIHRIFGGKLRSRVQCQRCKHNSDTFDPILDLSLDLRKSSSITEALEKFTSVDNLTGSEKYKCEQCKRPVDATKKFTIHKAPFVLTIHLKRFSHSGQKINRQINYPESLALTKSMLSEGQSPQHYKLQSIVHHHGSGPNSGHYIASVKGAAGNRWYEMNDSSVHSIRGVPTNTHDAYILFYVRDPGHALNNAVRTESLLGSKRKLSEAGDEGEEKRPKVRPGEEYGTPLKKQPLTASPSVQQPRHIGINPSSFYGTTPTSSNTRAKNQRPTLFRNMDSADDSDDGNDDLGEAIQSPQSLPAPSPGSLISMANQSSKKKKGHHRDTLGLGIRAGNQKSRLIGSPFSVGRDNLQKPFHARMKDKHGNRFR